MYNFLIYISISVISIFSNVCIGNTPNEPPPENYPPPSKNKLDQYYIDNHGVGFGLSEHGVSGIKIYYDYNLHDKYRSQIHTYFFNGSDTMDNLFGHTILESKKTTIGGSYRKVFKKGFFIGGDLSSSSGELIYNSPVPTSDPNLDLQQYNYNSVSFGAEGGWQGNDFYYFSIGLTARTVLAVSQDDIEKNGTEFFNIKDEFGHRTFAKKMWKNITSQNSIYIGFGWFIVP